MVAVPSCACLAWFKMISYVCVLMETCKPSEVLCVRIGRSRGSPHWAELLFWQWLVCIMLALPTAKNAGRFFNWLQKCLLSGFLPILNSWGHHYMQSNSKNPMLQSIRECIHFQSYKVYLIAKIWTSKFLFETPLSFRRSTLGSKNHADYLFHGSCFYS